MTISGLVQPRPDNLPHPGLMSSASLPLDLVSVIVPVYNGADSLRACLTALLASDYPAFEVIVVDDHSTDNSIAVAREFSCQTVCMPTNSGAAAARNRGAQMARGDILFFLDADILVEPDTLSKIIATFYALPGISAMFCSYQPGTIPTNFWSEYKNLVHHYTHQISNNEAATFCGGFGAIKRQVFLDFDGFDEGYRSLEDIELGYRLHQAGHRIFLNKDIQLTHCKEYSLLGLLKSDVLHRAVPWTKIMLGKRVFRNDLNTKSNNVLSVPLAFLLLLNIPLIGLFRQSVYAFVGLLAIFIALNAQFYAFIWRQKKTVFTLKAIVMHWFNYVYSGVGLLIGVVVFIRDRAQPSPRDDHSTEAT